MTIPQTPLPVQKSKSFKILLILLILAASLAAGCSPPPPPSMPGLPKPIPQTPYGNNLVPLPTQHVPAAGPSITDITHNQGAFSGEVVPAYEKFEIDFHVETAASNVQLPYDPAPPPGLPPEIGISVDAQFTPDDWATVYTIPAFYYQHFDHEIKQGREWIYPSGKFWWKVRFAPPTPGVWQFRLTAADATGRTQSSPKSFTVSDSPNRGFIRVSPTDPRYFEFGNGLYFPGLGYNMNYDQISWNNPVLENENKFKIMSDNGIELVRMWLSQWGIFGPSWNPWNAIDPALHSQAIPWTGITFSEAYPGSEVAMKIDAARNACMFLGFQKSPPAVKRNTPYRLRVRYKTQEIDGPRIHGQDFGFVAKTGDWLRGAGQDCDLPGTGKYLTGHQSANTPVWEMLEGTFTTGNADFLPNFYLVMENVWAGSVYIDRVWIEEVFANGSIGPNILAKPWMAHHFYFDQRNSFAFDRVLELAEEYGVYLRPVILEKNDFIFNHLDTAGEFTWDGSNENFYGHGRVMTKVRWLQQAWWRYLQARWGYSTSIHSWELLNEGDPTSTNHFTLADEFGAFMHQFVPNDHLVSTSFWHSFPAQSFWRNPEYSEVDFADLHRYIPQDSPLFLDAAQATVDPSMTYGAFESNGAEIPVIRGETGFVNQGPESPTHLLVRDTQGIWLHNLIWAGTNAGGLIESYWYLKPHIYAETRNGDIYDHRSQFKPYYNFIQDVPLSNGHHQALNFATSDPRLRVLGQHDQENSTAILWIQHKDHTWHHVANQIPIQPVTAVVTLTDFRPGARYTIQWWDPYEPDPTLQIFASSSTLASEKGVIEIPIVDLATDVALKVFGENQQLSR